MVNQTQTNRYSRDVVILLIVLLAAFIHGMIYVFIMPPWQHYDEPKHFEYAWLIAKHHGLPKPGDNDPGLSKQVVESMIANDFYRNIGGIPDIHQPNLQIPGYSQLEEKPIYYVLASVPLRLFSLKPIESQLYAARFVSLLLFLLTVLACWGIAKEISPPSSYIRWMAPLFIALLPGLSDVMTSVNNDTAAVAAMSIFFWIVIIQLKRGITLGNLALIIFITILCLFTKRTSYLALPLLFVFLAIYFGRRFASSLSMYVLLLILIIGIIFALVDYSGISGWYAVSDGSLRSQNSAVSSVLGTHGFKICSESEKTQLIQLLPHKKMRSMEGKILTFGGWMWASEPVVHRTPEFFIKAEEKGYYETIQISQEPRYFSVRVVPKNIPARSWMILKPDLDNPIFLLDIYYDGLFVVEGDIASEIPPTYLDKEGKFLEYRGERYTNLLKNGSAEQAGLRIRPWADRVGSIIFSDYGQDSFSLAFYTIAKIDATSWYYQGNFISIFRTFWAKFGWGHVPLLGNKPYRVLGWVTIIGIAGFLVYFWRGRYRHRWDILIFFGISLCLIWGLTLIRGSNYVLLRAGFRSVARYVFPSIIPTAFVLVYGWNELLDLSSRGKHQLKQYTGLLFCGLLILLDVYSIYSIYVYYY